MKGFRNTPTRLALVILFENDPQGFPQIYNGWTNTGQFWNWKYSYCGPLHTSTPRKSIYTNRLQKQLRTRGHTHKARSHSQSDGQFLFKIIVPLPKPERPYKPREREGRDHDDSCWLQRIRGSRRVFTGCTKLVSAWRKHPQQQKQQQEQQRPERQERRAPILYLRGLRSFHRGRVSSLGRRRRKGRYGGLDRRRRGVDTGRTCRLRWKETFSDDADLPLRSLLVAHIGPSRIRWGYKNGKKNSHKGGGWAGRRVRGRGGGAGLSLRRRSLPICFFLPPCRWRGTAFNGAGVVFPINSTIIIVLIVLRYVVFSISRTGSINTHTQYGIYL